MAAFMPRLRRSSIGKLVSVEDFYRASCVGTPRKTLREHLTNRDAFARRRLGAVSARLATIHQGWEAVLEVGAERRRLLLPGTGGA